MSLADATLNRAPGRYARAVAPLEYVWEKTNSAVVSLASGAGPIQQRLVSAAHTLMLLKPEDFGTDDLRLQWSSIMESLTALDALAGDEGSLEATVSRMSEDQATSIASDIATLNGLHLLHMLDAAERGVIVCSECQNRWNGAGEEIEAQWLVNQDGAGALNLFCPNCARREFRA